MTTMAQESYSIRSKPLSFPKLLLVTWICVSVIFVFCCGFVFLNNGKFPSGFVEKVVKFNVLFIPLSVGLAWFAVVVRKIEMNVIWLVNDHGVSLIKHGNELSHIEWKAISKVSYRKNRLVLVTMPRFAGWSLNGVSSDDADRVRYFFMLKNKK